jgi:cytochrome P450
MWQLRVTTLPDSCDSFRVGHQSYIQNSVVTLSLLVVIVVLALLLIGRHTIYPALISPLAQVRSAHPLCALTQQWLDHQMKAHRPWSAIREAHSKLGPLVRIGPREVSVASIEGLQKVYTAGLDRDPSYALFKSYGTHNLLSFQDGKCHSAQKRIISAVYAKSFLQHSVDMKTLTREIIGERLLPQLTQLASDQQNCNIMPLAGSVGMDMLTAYLFGLDSGTNWLRTPTEAQRYLGKFDASRDDPDFLAYSESACMGMCEAARVVVQEGNVSGVTRPVVFEKLYKSLKESQPATGHTEEQMMKCVASEMMDQMHASHKPTSIILTYAVWHLSLDTDLQGRLRAELSSLNPRILPNIQAGDEFDLPSASTIDSLPLLSCIVTETLRLHAAVPGSQSRIVPMGGLTIHGKYLPPDTIISSNAFTLHRDEEIFPDAYSWQPERWAQRFASLGSSSDAVPMPRFFWPFGSGGKMCLGSNFALQSESSKQPFECSNTANFLPMIDGSVEAHLGLHILQLHHDDSR